MNRHTTAGGARWAANRRYLPEPFNLGLMLAIRRERAKALLDALTCDSEAEGSLLAPIEQSQEVWACGVTYLRSRDARKAESQVGDVYRMVYEARRPEIFFKSVGWRVAGPGEAVRVRADSAWNVPEPELVLVVNSWREIVGFTLGNDVTSRTIEGENPLYLPQAKIYRGSCALGPGIVLAGPEEMRDLPIQLEILRGGRPVFRGETNLGNMKRTFDELIDYLFLESVFPEGVFVMTGTGIVPPESFTLEPGDLVRVGTVLPTGEPYVLGNPVAS